MTRKDLKQFSLLKDFLDSAVAEYNNVSFIAADPISIPKSYTSKQDIEITAFWTAMFSWGQRKTIINKSQELFGLMGNEPYNFILNHKEKDRKRFSAFKHRTFQYTDTLYFLEFLQHHYKNNVSLEAAFIPEDKAPYSIEQGLTHFHNYFFSLKNAPQRTKKHVSTPSRKSSCKRLNMFLRWMVRKDKGNVDFGIWKQINSADLMIPLDVHVYRVASKLKLVQRKQTDWLTVVELTSRLKAFDPDDPVKYDYALFGLGVLQKDLQFPPV